MNAMSCSERIRRASAVVSAAMSTNWKLGTMSGDVDELPSGRGVGTSLELDRDMFLGPCEPHEGVDATVEAGRLCHDIETGDRSQDPQGFGCEPASDIY